MYLNGAFVFKWGYNVFVLFFCLFVCFVRVKGAGLSDSEDTLIQKTQNNDQTLLFEEVNLSVDITARSRERLNVEMDESREKVILTGLRLVCLVS